MGDLLFTDERRETSALSIVLERLCARWRVTQQRPRAYARPRWTPDLILKFRGPKNAQWRVIIASGDDLSPKDAAALAKKMFAHAQRLGGNIIPLVTARFLNRQMREALHAEDLSYADSTGNLRINGHHPLLVFEAIGAKADPFRSVPA